MVLLAGSLRWFRFVLWRGSRLEARQLSLPGGVHLDHPVKKSSFPTLKSVLAFFPFAVTGQCILMPQKYLASSDASCLVQSLPLYLQIMIFCLELPSRLAVVIWHSTVNRTPPPQTHFSTIYLFVVCRDLWILFLNGLWFIAVIIWVQNCPRSGPFKLTPMPS